MDNLICKSINSITTELGHLVYINKYAPNYSSVNEEYNDRLIAFKRLYYDTYRFLSKYVPNCGILTLLPRHVYWQITPVQLDHILYLLQGDELELIKYLMRLNLNPMEQLYDRYIAILGNAKLDYINSKSKD